MAPGWWLCWRYGTASQECWCNVPQIARLVVEARGVTNNSVILVAFDKEEEGCEGSRAFVRLESLLSCTCIARDFLIPVVILKHGSGVQGLYNMDTIIALRREADSQDVPDVYEKTDPALAKDIRDTGSRYSWWWRGGQHFSGETSSSRSAGTSLETRGWLRCLPSTW